MKTSKDPIIVVGAGLSGLSAALELEAAGESCVILESSNQIGGKLQTDIYKEAYRLDLGFQVLLPSYPELKHLGNLDEELDLHYFSSGARLEMDNQSLIIANPISHPSRFLSTAFGRYASLRDKFLVMKMQIEVRTGDPDRLLDKPKQTTSDYLRAYGFSEKIITSFWQPFFSGIFLENKLVTAAGFFRYLVRMFASSPVAVPKLGMAELPKLMAQRLKKSEIKLNTEVINFTPAHVELSNGNKISARAVIGQTQGSTHQKDEGPFGMVSSFWFSASEPPFEGPWLSLNSRSNSKQKTINHVAILSNVSPAYALKGDALICVNAVQPPSNLNINYLLEQAQDLYGPTVKSWVHLRTDEIKRAFPLYLNRTDQDTPSQQGALLRGRTAARSTLSQL